MRAAVAVLALAAAACGPSQDARFAEAGARASASTRAGRHADAAARWLEAARIAGTAVDRDEALYRAAASYERAQNVPRALELYARLERGSGERAARASFDRARLVRERDETQGDALLVAALRRHPNSGLAPRAFREHLVRREAEGGTPAALEAATRLASELAATELDETICYERARLLERLGSLREARDAYLETAARHPYPEGALWDDALARAARVEELLDRPRAAVALYERMLAERESSRGLGSYERARYAEARFRIAELYRDRFGDAARARLEFRRVYAEHTTSLLRDDALWQEALLAERAGDRPKACAALVLLARELPDSRYAPCARSVCPAAPASTARPCRFDFPETRGRREDAAGAPHSSSSSSSSSP